MHLDYVRRGGGRLKLYPKNKTSMVQVLCLLPEDTLPSSYQRVLGGPLQGIGEQVVDVERVSDWSALNRRCRVLSEPATVAVIDPYLGTSDGIHRRALRRFRESFPSVRIVACSGFEDARVDEIVALVEIGVEEIVDWSETHADGGLRRAIARASVDARRPLRDCLRTRYGETLSWPVLDFLFVRPRPNLKVSHLARRQSLSPRSLERHLCEDGLETPQRLIMRSLLYHASLLLLDPGRTVETVGRALGFSDCSSICKACKWHLGLSPTELRQGLPITSWCRLLERNRDSPSTVYRRNH